MKYLSCYVYSFVSATAVLFQLFQSREKWTLILLGLIKHIWILYLWFEFCFSEKLCSDGLEKFGIEWCRDQGTPLSLLLIVSVPSWHIMTRKTAQWWEGMSFLLPFSCFCFLLSLVPALAPEPNIMKLDRYEWKWDY